MSDKFQQAVAYGRDLRNNYTARNNLLDQMERMFLMQWEEEGDVQRRYENVKLTKSPDARNAIQGAIRLLIAADPVFSVPFDMDGGSDEEASGRIEKFADAMWRAAGRVRGDPLQYDVVRSALLFDEIHLSVTSTADLLDNARGGSKAQQVRAEKIAKVTPYVFDVHDPRGGYPEFDGLGLRTYYRESKMQVSQVKEMFGQEAARQLSRGGKQLGDLETVTICDLWDLAERCVWMDGGDEPLIQMEHGLPFIPWVVHRVEGSRLFEEPEYQRQPFLYTLYKSGLWARQNLLLTVLYTQVFAIGANPLFVEKLNAAGAGVEIDRETPGGSVRIPYGGDYYPLINKGVIDPSIFQARDVAEQKVTESTIYAQTLGEPLGANAPFSMVALLSQAGRLPLTVPQRKASWAIADAVKMALEWMRLDAAEGTARYDGRALTLIPEDIPEECDLVVKLDIALPQDKMQSANVANLVVGGRLASRRWARENLLQIGQSDQMDREIWDEAASDLLFTQYIQEQQQKLAQMQAQAQQMQAGGAPGGMPPGPGGPGMGGPGMGGPGMGGPGGPGGPAPEMMGPEQGVPMAGPMEMGAGPQGGMAPPGPGVGVGM